MREQTSIKTIIMDNIVTIMFVALCFVCYLNSGLSLNFVLMGLFERLSRNAFIVLALVIPIVAGMGINFAITIGAMAAQISLLWVLEWRIPGIEGLLVAALMTMPIAGFFGYLIGNLLNKMKGQEMIGSMILGFFANGLYQLLFLFIFGNLSPLNAPGLVIKGSTGVANTMDLSKAIDKDHAPLKYALDGLWKVPFDVAVFIFAGVIALFVLISFLRKRTTVKAMIVRLAVCALCCVAVLIPDVRNLFSMVRIPMVTFLIIGVLCLFNVGIMRTRIGQQFRAVGQNGTVANSAGINVNKTRIIAIIISTILAGWGQIIFVQNMGSFQTYGAHEQVGLYAGAAILVGGASIVRATNSQALLGCFLFHLLFLVAPDAGKNLLGQADIGEYFRVFISYGVIALSLVLHAWRTQASNKRPTLAGAPKEA